MKLRVGLKAALAVITLLTAGPGMAADFMAGAAKADITPDVQKMEIPSSGYGNRGKKPMEGVHDPVYCKALALTDGEEKAAIVTCDLSGISPSVRQMIIERLDGQGYTDENLMMTASHTHSGPGALEDNIYARVVFGGYNEEYAISVADRVAAAIRQADAGMEHAVLKAGTATVKDATRNRRDPAKSYDYDTRRFTDAYEPERPENVVDPEVTVLKIDGIDGSPIAVMFNFATHGTVLGADNMLISADWPGVTQREIEDRYPGAVAMFVNGAIGDQAPAMDDDDTSDMEYLEIIGKKVAAGVFDAAESAEPITAYPVVPVMERREVPAGNLVIDSSLNGKPIHIKFPKAFVRHYFPEVPLQAVRLGDAVIMGTPMEMVSDIGHAMKAGAKGQGISYPVVAGLANAKLFYCVTPDDFPQGGYEVGLTIYGKTEAAMLIGEQMLLVRDTMQQ